MTSLPAALQTGLALVLGLLIGSFLNVVIHRLPKMMERQWQAECASMSGSDAPEPPRYNLVYPPSACVHCQAPIRAWQNIPLLSFALQRGRCANCGGAISWRYPLVELVSGLMLAAFAGHWGLSGYWLWASGFGLTLLALALIDAATQLLPDDLTYPLLWAGLLFNLDAGFVPLSQAVVGAVAGYLILWSVYWLFKLTTGKEGMGYGDFKLLAALGAWLGWQMLPLIILLSSLVGALVGIVLMAAARQGRGQPMPFGPYLAAAGLIAFLWGKPILAWYLGG
ncbi:A24 family peptidase [Vogesella sp. LIG4]|uniref:prepilin peptidase n=1 Tax=Vogesella sp. LIG4 TaxID=1192162 RepID=UPI001E441F33|nr:A24 family peptidase [Vogesella sp. LIG4]